MSEIFKETRLKIILLFCLILLAREITRLDIMTYLDPASNLGPKTAILAGRWGRLPIDNEYTDLL